MSKKIISTEAKVFIYVSYMVLFTVYLGMKDSSSLWFIIMLIGTIMYVTALIFAWEEMYPDDEKKSVEEKNGVSDLSKNNIPVSKAKIEVDEREALKQKKIKSHITGIKRFRTDAKKALLVEMPNLKQYNLYMREMEEKIIEKGGEKQVQTFLKIDSFLKDYTRKINDNIDVIRTSLTTIDGIEDRIKKEYNRTDAEYLYETIQGKLSALEGRGPIGFESSIAMLINMAGKVEKSIRGQVVTLEMYESLAMTMLNLYIGGKLIRYYEIYESFDKMGVFDSSWQRKAIDKLDSIDKSLLSIDNGLSKLNDNFDNLLNSSDKIINELESIGSGVALSNFIATISAYNIWKVKINTR